MAGSRSADRERGRRGQRGAGPGSLDTFSVPPIRTTSCREIARPSPVPPKRREVELSAWVNASKRCSACRLAMPMPVSRTDSSSRAGPVASSWIRQRSEIDLSRGGELDGVAEQVQQYLAQPAGIALKSCGQSRVDLAGQLRPCSSARAASSDAPLDDRARIERHASMSSLPASILEKSRMSLITASSASADEPRSRRIPAARVRSVPSSRPLMPMHAVHRGADLVAHVGQELALEARSLHRLIAGRLQSALMVIRSVMSCTNALNPPPSSCAQTPTSTGIS